MYDGLGPGKRQSTKAEHSLWPRQKQKSMWNCYHLTGKITWVWFRCHQCYALLGLQINLFLFQQIATSKRNTQRIWHVSDISQLTIVIALLLFQRLTGGSPRENGITEADFAWSMKMEGSYVEYADHILFHTQHNCAYHLTSTGTLHNIFKSLSVATHMWST